MSMLGSAATGHFVVSGIEEGSTIIRVVDLGSYEAHEKKHGESDLSRPASIYNSRKETGCSLGTQPFC